MSYLSDNVLLLTVDGEERTRRMLRVLKTRGSAHDTRVREVEISAAGLADSRMSDADRVRSRCHPDVEQLRRLAEIGRAFTYTTSLDQVARIAVERGARLAERDGRAC